MLDRMTNLRGIGTKTTLAATIVVSLLTVRMTSWKVDKISGAALKNVISAWQGNTLKQFKVWMQEV